MSVFEKNCWYWSSKNRIIESQLQQIDSHKWFQLKLEDFNSARLSKLIGFLGADKNHKLHIQTSNTAKYEKYNFERWSAQEKEIFEKWCAEGMDKWYPGWRISQNQLLALSEVILTLT